MLNSFSDLDFYRLHFMDLTFWETPVRLVCGRHGYDCRKVTLPLPGTFPTFIVETVNSAVQLAHRSIVVKFFGPLFEGEESFRVERTVGNWLTQQSMPIHSPRILAEGQLTQEWNYLVFEHIAGESISQHWQKLSQEALARVARQVGGILKKLHTLPAPEISRSINASRSAVEESGWKGFSAFLDQQRSQCKVHHQQWNDLPEQLLGELPDYILPIEQLIDLALTPHLIHADLTCDHLLGRLIPPSSQLSQARLAGSLAGTDWETLAIIDWGDARIGNILYELVAVHLDLFQADKRWLAICLENYGIPTFYQQEFARKAFSMVLLHQFPMPARIYAPYQEARSLQELAEGLFAL